MVERLSDRAETVCNKLLSNHNIKVKRDWIVDCVKFFISQSAIINDETLYQQALQQFLLADIKEASNTVIPAMIQQKREAFTLNGIFVLQLNFLIDISESPYDQWRRLHNLKLDDVEENRQPKAFQSKKKRILKLELTDGVKNVTAMEYTVIPSLNTKLSPGVKLQIIGPLQVVNHILLLESNNVKILGGDVEDYLIVNAYENVLLRALNRPTTETPITDYLEDQPLHENNHQRPQIQPKPMSDMKKAQLPVNNFDDDDDDIDMEILMQIEEDERAKRNEAARTTEARPSIVLDDDDDDAFLQAELNENQHTNGNFTAMEISNTPPKVVVRANDLLIPSNVFHGEESREDSEDIIPKKIARIEPTLRIGSTLAECSGSLEITNDLYKFKSHDGDNLVTVDQYLQLDTIDKVNRNYVMKAKFITISLSAIKVARKQWKFRSELGDDYSYQKLPVKVDSKILDRESGHTGENMFLMYQASKERPAFREEIQDVINKVSGRLAEFDGFVKVELELSSDSQLSYTVIDLFNNEQTKFAFCQKAIEENLQKVIIL